MAERRAIVIGGGIGGLTAAIALTGAGLAVDVFERAPELNEVGAGISLWLNALRVLDRLKLGDAIRAASVPAAAVGLRTWQGDLLVPDPLAGLQRTRGVVVCRVMHRAELQSALFQACGAARVHLGARATGFRGDKDGVIVDFDGCEHARGDPSSAPTASIRSCARSCGEPSGRAIRPRRGAGPCDSSTEAAPANRGDTGRASVRRR